MDSSSQLICIFQGCGKTFKAKKSLIEHMRIHNGEKPYECQHPSCGQRFTQFSSLQKHERIHTGEKPYKCEICKRDFTQVSNLRRHEKTHDVSKPSFLKNYLKPSSSTSDLKDNLEAEDRREIREKYSCKICKKVYYQRSTLKKHLKEHDNELISTVYEPSSPKRIPTTESTASCKKVDIKPCKKANIKPCQSNKIKQEEPEDAAESHTLQMPEPSKLVFVHPAQTLNASPMQLPIKKGASKDSDSGLPKFEDQFLNNFSLAYLYRPDITGLGIGTVPLVPILNLKFNDGVPISNFVGPLILNKANLSKGIVKYRGEIFYLQNNLLMQAKPTGELTTRVIANDTLNPSRCSNLPEISHYPDYQTLRSAYQEIVENYGKCVTMDMLLSGNNCNSFTCKCGPGRPGCNKCDCGVNDKDEKTPAPLLTTTAKASNPVAANSNSQSNELDECPLEDEFCNNVKNKREVNSDAHICLCKITRKFKHVHGPNCGHVSIAHDDHIDYVVGGKLHHPDGDHCDDHGPICFIDTISEDYAIGLISSGSLPECKV